MTNLGSTFQFCAVARDPSCGQPASQNNTTVIASAPSPETMERQQESSGQEGDAWCVFRNRSVLTAMGAEIVCSLTSTGRFLLAPVTFPRTFCRGAVHQFTKFKVTSPEIYNLVEQPQLLHLSKCIWGD